MPLAPPVTITVLPVKVESSASVTSANNDIISFRSDVQRYNVQGHRGSKIVCWKKVSFKIIILLVLIEFRVRLSSIKGRPTPAEYKLSIMWGSLFHETLNNYILTFANNFLSSSALRVRLIVEEE